VDMVFRSCTKCSEGVLKVFQGVSVQTVDYRDQAELPAPPKVGSVKLVDPYRDFLFALSEKKGEVSIDPSDIAVYFRRQENNQSFKNAKQKRFLLKVAFTSKENLHEFSRSKSYPLSMVPYFCKRPEAIVNLSSPRVFWQGLEVSAPLKYAVQQGEGELLTYYAFLNVTYEFTGPSSYERFDLRKNPEDICLQLRGGNMGIGFESNVVVIHKEKITEALKNLLPTFYQSSN